MKIIGDFGFMSSNDIDKFNGINTITAKTGTPIVLDSSVAWFDCRVVKSIDLGSHYLIIGEVEDAEIVLDEEPLTYQHYRDKYKMLSPKNSPTYIEKSLLDADLPSVSKEENKHEDDHEHDYVFDGQSWVCVICGFTYNPEEGDPSMGIPPGTRFEDLPEDYKCPICNASKEYFKKV
jgi:rubredoxin